MGVDIQEKRERLSKVIDTTTLKDEVIHRLFDKEQHKRQEKVEKQLRAILRKSKY